MYERRQSLQAPSLNHWRKARSLIRELSVDFFINTNSFTLVVEIWYEIEVISILLFAMTYTQMI